MELLDDYFQIATSSSTFCAETSTKSGDRPQIHTLKVSVNNMSTITFLKAIKTNASRICAALTRILLVRLLSNSTSIL